MRISDVATLTLAGSKLFLALEQSPLALHAPAIPRQGAVGAQYTMTGNGDSQNIGGTGAGHRAQRFGRADALRHLGIARRRPWRNLPQSRPNFLLKIRAPDVKRKIERTTWILDRLGRRGDQLVQAGIILDQFGSGELRLQFADHPLRIVAEQNGADSSGLEAVLP